jgi:hypothetical protein
MDGDDNAEETAELEMKALMKELKELTGVPNTEGKIDSFSDSTKLRSIKKVRRVLNN